MHSKAVNLERKPATLTDIYKSTPLGRAFSSGQQEERAHVRKLLEIAYMIAKEEIPFTKYPTIMELEKRQGVSLGSAYTTEHKCREFTVLIGECMRDKVLDYVRQSHYLAVLIDGSTDSTVIEKELVYVMYVGPEGKAVFFFAIERCFGCNSSRDSEVVS